MKKGLRAFWLGILSFIGLAICLLCSEKAFADNGMNVQTHTADEIRQHIQESGSTKEDFSYKTEPVLDGEILPDAELSDAGELSDTCLLSALATLNNIRYIVGIDYDVTENHSYTEQCQAASMLNDINRELSHEPKTPSCLDDDCPIVVFGKNGAKNSNIVSGYSSFYNAIISGWMYDSDNSNIKVLRYRRWIINPGMAATGFGAVGKYLSMYTSDTQKLSNYKNVAWPAQMMPIDYFTGYSAWSLSTGNTETIGDVHVTLTRQRDGQIWHFSQESADGYFNVDNSDYGQTGCIIFRPKAVGPYRINDQFHVIIEGLKDGTLEYDVTFFDLIQVTDITINEESLVVETGNSISLNSVASAYPSDATDPTITWTSSDPETAVIENNSVKGLKGGNVTLTATSADGSVSKSIPLHVHNYQYDRTENDLAYFYCDSCGDEQTGAVPTNYGFRWKEEGDTSYAVSLPESMDTGSVLYCWIFVTPYPFEAEKKYTDMIIETDPAVADAEYIYYGGAGSYYWNITWKKAGQHTITIYPKYNPDPSLRRTFTINIVKALEGVSIKLDKATLQPYGEQLVFTAEPDGGRDLVYRFTLIDADGNETELRDYDTSDSYTWRINQVGNYTVRVEAKVGDKDRIVSAITQPLIFEKAGTVLKEGTYITSGSELTYGQKVTELPVGDAAFVSAVTEETVQGTLEWKNPDEIPNVGDYNAVWKFTPNDGDHYEGTEGTVPITVVKATFPPGAPQGTITVPNKVTTVTNKILSRYPGWEFSDDSIGTELTVDEPVICTVVYTGADAENYESIETTIQVVRSEVQIVTRIYGSGRYETAFLVADELKEKLGVEKFEAVILADGRNYPDALAGSYLSSQFEAPILLVNNSHIPAVQDYIKENLNAEDGVIYILGGTGAVPDAVMEGMEGYTFERLAGASRYETNLEILKAGPDNDEIVVCTGKDYADSLSASAVGRPILLVKNTLQDSQKAYLETLEGEKTFCIIGGEGAVTKDVENALKAYGTVKRVFGASRYDTSVAVAEEFFPGADAAVLAYGQNFPDGLCGGALAYYINGAGGEGAPLILTRDSKAQIAAAFTYEKEIRSGAVLGGTALISDESVRSIFQMEESDKIEVITNTN